VNIKEKWQKEYKPIESNAVTASLAQIEINKKQQLIGRMKAIEEFLPDLAIMNKEHEEETEKLKANATTSEMLRLKEADKALKQEYEIGSFRHFKTDLLKWIEENKYCKGFTMIWEIPVDDLINYIKKDK